MQYYNNIIQSEFKTGLICFSIIFQLPLLSNWAKFVVSLKFSRFLLYEYDHGLWTPNKGKNQRNLKFWAVLADKICFGRDPISPSGSFPSFPSVFALPVLHQNTFWVFNITYSPSAFPKVFVYTSGME